MHTELSIRHEPKIIRIINSTAYDNYDSLSDEPTFPNNKNWMEYSPPNVDLLRWRLGKYWNRNRILDYPRGGFRTRPHPLLSFVGGVRLSATASLSPQSGELWRKKEIFQISSRHGRADLDGGTINCEDYDEGSNERELCKVNKWINLIDHTQSPVNAGRIVSTFSKLRTDPEDINSAPIKFEDCVFDFEVPISKNDLSERTHESVRVFEAEIKPVYNFYVQSYETILARETNPPSEPLLPNFYSFMTVMQAQVSAFNQPNRVDTIFEKQLTLGGAIEETIATGEIINQNEEIVAKISKGQYFSKYAHAYAKFVGTGNEPWEQDDPAQGKIEDRFRNLIAPLSNMDLFTDYNEKTNQFPMYVDINFSTDISTEVADILQQTRLSSVLLKDVVQNVTPNQRISNFQPDTGSYNFLGPSEPRNPTTDLPFLPFSASYSDATKIGNLKSWDITKWFKFLVESTTLGTNPRPFLNVTGGVFLGKYNEEMQLAQDNPSFNFFKNIMIYSFAKKYFDLTRLRHDGGKMRTFADILNGKLAYHETVFYKIEKWPMNLEGGVSDTTPNAAPIQTFYLPNTSNIDVLKYIDTQVVYGKSYIYRIYAYEMVFGTKYHYQLNKIPSPDGTHQGLSRSDMAEVCAIYTPSIKLIEMPYFEKNVVLLDSPPVWPDVNIIPYKGSRDKLLFLFTGNVGKYRMKPILLKDEDNQIIEAIRNSQGTDRFSNDGELIEERVEFKSDDPPSIFEVFRIQGVAPTSYGDFIGNQIATVFTPSFDTPCKSAAAASWVDRTIQPNIKYYYTFRTIDNHGNFSNPSPVYEVEIVYDGGLPFLLIKAVNFKKVINPPQTPSRIFKKYLRIRPAFLQGIIDYKNSGTTAAGMLIDPVTEDKNLNIQTLTNFSPTGDWIKLGTSDQRLWGKKIKVRVVSKKTGKKIDLNIDFAQSHEAPENDDGNILCEK